MFRFAWLTILGATLVRALPKGIPYQADIISPYMEFREEARKSIIIFFQNFSYETAKIGFQFPFEIFKIDFMSLIICDFIQTILINCREKNNRVFFPNNTGIVHTIYTPKFFPLIMNNHISYDSKKYGE